MRDGSEISRKGWETRRRRYGESGMPIPQFVDPIYAEDLYRRWVYVHDIRAMGECAVRETA